MADQSTSSRARWGRLPRGPEFRTAAVAGAVVLLLVAVLALVDPTGLLAPVGGRGMPVVGFGGAYQWAPLVVGLPVLLFGTMLPVYLLSRSGRGVFAFTWVSVVGAVALAAASTGLVAVIPLLGPHLGLAAALEFTVATSGFAGLKGLVAGPLVGAAAVLARRRRASGSASDARSEGAPGALSTSGRGPWLGSGSAFAVAVTGAVVALAAVVGSNWRGGPVGYAFAGPLLAPTSAASALGTLAGTAVFLGLFAVSVRVVLRRLPDRAWLAVWLSALVAGVGLGVVGSVVAALTGHLDDAGPDSWWIATTLITVATAIGYGVGIGLVAGLATGLTWRWRARVLPGTGDTSARRRRTWVVVGTLAILLAVPLVVPTTAPGPAAVAPLPPTGGLERLHLLPARTGDGLPVIGDVTGRQVMLRGREREPADRLLPARPGGPGDPALDRRRLRADRLVRVQRGSPGHVLVAAGADEGRVRRGLPRRGQGRGGIGQGARSLHRARHARGRLGQRTGRARRGVWRWDVADDRVGRRPGLGDDHRRCAALPVHGT